jgi:hypothetical protein
MAAEPLARAWHTVNLIRRRLRCFSNLEDDTGAWAAYTSMACGPKKIDSQSAAALHPRRIIMFPQIGDQTVIAFKHIQFHGKWKRTFPLYGMSYEAMSDAEIIVVEEVTSNQVKTYWFKLKVGDEAFVAYADSQVHVPAHCSKSEPGDVIRCAA